MRQAVLLGNPGTKRTEYLRQAAARAAVPVLFVDWADCEGWIAHIPENQGNQYFLKIDPPLWESCSLGELDRLAAEYRGRLEKLEKAASRHSIEFLNHPLPIGELLDKRECKARLSAAGLPVTEVLQWREERPFSMMKKKPADRELLTDRSGLANKLLERMEEQGICQVFIKPVNGSGAAGVSAFRRQPRTGQMALYTCSLERPDTGFINTKRLRRFSKPSEIFPLLDKLLGLDCVVERWYAKAEYQGYSYDLRVVAQEGKMDFLLARLSKGPITNLHLNNHPLEASALGLPESVIATVGHICQKAMNCFPGLRSAGIDILLEKGSLRPRIIEMNAQGDLIYQDIYSHNAIYGHQAEIMKRWLEAGEDGSSIRWQK